MAVSPEDARGLALAAEMDATAARLALAVDGMRHLVFRHADLTRLAGAAKRSSERAARMDARAERAEHRARCARAAASQAQDWVARHLLLHDAELHDRSAAAQRQSAMALRTNAHTDELIALHSASADERADARLQLQRPSAPDS